jgi:hypothetical protein
MMPDTPLKIRGDNDTGFELECNIELRLLVATAALGQLRGHGFQNPNISASIPFGRP